MTALRTIILAVAMAAVVVPSASAQAAKFDSPQDELIAGLNDVRAKHGLRALREAPRLARSSGVYARHLIRTGTFAHGSSYAKAGFRRSGEILALQRGGRRTPGGAVRQWLASSGHRALILDRGFRYVGAGLGRSSSTSVWVVHFGQN